MKIISKEKSAAAKEAEEIWLLYGKDIKRLCLARMRGVYENYAEDCVQETFLALLEFLESGGSLHNARGWLYETAKNTMGTVFRKVKIKDKYVTYINDNCRSSESEVFDLAFPKCEVSQEHIERGKDAVLQMLTDDERELLENITVNKMSLIEIAEKQGISLSLAKKNSVLLKAKLRRLVKEWAQFFEE